MPALALLIAMPAWPQSNVGQISGKVFDSSGAVIPRCTISVTNLQTGLQQATLTDEGGTYSFPSMPRGSYTVRVEAKGFRPSEQAGVVLDAATRRAVEFTLEVGAVTEAVSGQSVPATAGPSAGPPPVPSNESAAPEPTASSTVPARAERQDPHGHRSCPPAVLLC